VIDQCCDRRKAVRLKQKIKTFKPEPLKEWLEERLPQPVDDLEEWKIEE